MQLVTLIPATKDGNMQGAPTTAPLRGGIKKLFFFTSCKKGGGSRPKQKKGSRKYSDFFDQRGGGSHSIQKGFIRKNGIFWHNLPKKGGFYIKNW